MSTAEDIWDDIRLNAVHDQHEASGENRWPQCPLCDDEEEPDDVRDPWDEEVEDDRPPSCFGPLGLRVLVEQCSTCIFRPGNLMHLNAGRLKDMVESVEASQTYVICHQTLDDDPAAVCRGSYEKVYTDAIKVAERIGFIEFVKGPVK